MNRLFLILISIFLLGSGLFAQTTTQTNKIVNDKNLEGASKILSNLDAAANKKMNTKDAIRCAQSIYTKANILSFVKSIKSTKYISIARDYMTKAKEVIKNSTHLDTKDIEELNREFKAAEIELTWRPTRDFLKQVSEKGFCYIDKKTLEGTGAIDKVEINTALYAVP
jgi:anionic cell wall polymer biosynthesis LytR-Cps2A-Psr (LCP) family protein